MCVRPFSLCAQNSGALHKHVKLLLNRADCPRCCPCEVARLWPACSHLSALPIFTEDPVVSAGSWPLLSSGRAICSNIRHLNPTPFSSRPCTETTTRMQTYKSCLLSVDVKLGVQEHAKIPSLWLFLHSCYQTWREQILQEFKDANPLLKR